MKKTLFCTALVAIVMAGCSEDQGLVYNDKARIQFVSQDANPPQDYPYSFVWQSDATQADTVYIPVRIIGGPASQERHVALEQVDEYIINYSYDRLGHDTDSVIETVANKAKAGVHYVPFDDPSARDLLKVKAGAVRDSIGIIVKRSADLKNGSVRLALRLVENDDFGMGELKFQQRTITISDLLEKPATWNRTTDYYLGTYSEAKHRLMMQVVGDKVDDAWVESCNSSKAFMLYWRTKFIEALEAYNTDPANITTGKAPLREDATNPNSAIVTFPSKM